MNRGYLRPGDGTYRSPDIVWNAIGPLNRWEGEPRGSLPLVVCGTTIWAVCRAASMVTALMLRAIDQCRPDLRILRHSNCPIPFRGPRVCRAHVQFRRRLERSGDKSIRGQQSQWLQRQALHESGHHDLVGEQRPGIQLPVEPITHDEAPSSKLAASPTESFPRALRGRDDVSCPSVCDHPSE
jgi:hypothetical protein